MADPGTVLVDRFWAGRGGLLCPELGCTFRPVVGWISEDMPSANGLSLDPSNQIGQSESTPRGRVSSAWPTRAAEDERNAVEGRVGGEAPGLCSAPSGDSANDVTPVGCEGAGSVVGGAGGARGGGSLGAIWPVPRVPMGCHTGGIVSRRGLGVCVCGARVCVRGACVCVRGARVCVRGACVRVRGARVSV